MIIVETADRVRTITLNRPQAKNSFNAALYDACTDGLIEAATDPNVAVVVITGHGDAFCAGTDLLEMAAQAKGERVEAKHGFPGLVDQLASFPKPLLLAINGLGVGIGATIAGLADLVFMSTEARLRCPFTRLAVAPEAASSYTFPLLLGRQQATWALLSSEWLSAEECLHMGLAFKVCLPSQLMTTTMAHARILASKPISSLVESKAAIVAAWRDHIDAARQRENGAFARLMGKPANIEALTAFAQKREPNFVGID